jgi:hypothetical protein
LRAAVRALADRTACGPAQLRPQHRDIGQAVPDREHLDADHGAAFDTIDREELCEYSDESESLTEAGIDFEAFAQRRGINSSAITDNWHY